ncbi:MAG TPA: YhjD/YihY/BrkB family envelope integrity protein [Gammaproteobacteria bacterium]|nr:YhjD/YihY/BrkB family envelope integrity protein [Gammaproteobacteria bacterium]
MSRKDHPLELIARLLWARDTDALPRQQARGLHALRLVFNVLRDLFSGELTMRAMSLVYTTLLALVPLLALSFSVLKAFGVHSEIEPLLLTFFAPLGPRGAELAHHIIGFVERVRVGVLGSVGLLLLIAMVISLIQKIEDGLNRIWRIQHRRSLIQRFSGYLSVIVVGPVLVLAAVGTTASLLSQQVVASLRAIEPFGLALYLFGELLPYLLVIAAFTATYLLLPNTRVRLGPALTGGVLAGAAWKLIGMIFASFAASSARYDLVYSGFAVVILALVWLYISWLVFLVGAQIAFYVQNPHFVSRNSLPHDLETTDPEGVALAIMYWTALRFRRREPPPDEDALAALLEIPGYQIGTVLNALIAHGLLLEIEEPSPGFVPGADPAAIALLDVIEASRDRHPDLPRPRPASLAPAVADVRGAVAEATRAALDGRTLGELVAGAGASPGGDQAGDSHEGD